MELRIDAQSTSLGEDMRYVVDQLRRENLERARSVWKTGEVRLFLRDEADQILGGCFASMNMGWIHILILWVDKAARGQGWGKRLIEKAEWLGREFDAVGAMVETTDFQARPFYESLGYTVFAELEDCPPDHITYILKKRWME